MAFEKFTQTNKSFAPKLSIRSNGQLGFNFGAIEKFKLENYPYAVLFYDKEVKKIGVYLTKSKDDEGASKLRVKNGNASVAAKSFLDYYSIPYGKTVRFEAVWDDKEKMIIATLK
jgi:hypothetical protein